MSPTIPEFWKLLAESRLLSPSECERLQREFGGVKGAATQGNVRTLAEWLIAENLISRYQAKVLMGGRSGPFYYGEYKIYDRIGKGPFAGMFRAVHHLTGHPCILHFLTGPATQNAVQWGRVVQRAQDYFSVVHPHLVRCYELVDLPSYKFLVMEGVTGEPLSEALSAAGGRLPLAEACRVARQVALALKQLHAGDRVQGDIRPATLWMEPGGNVKVPHLPLSRPGPVDLRALDPTGVLLDRADYLAPELGQPGRSPDELTDVYAVGCLLYTMIAGEPPFAGGTVLSKMGRHATEAIQPLDQIAGAPAALAEVVAYMMAKNPSVRYQTAGEAADALTPFVIHAHHAPSPALSVPTLPAFEQFIVQKQAMLAARGQSGEAAAARPKQPIRVAATRPSAEAFAGIGADAGAAAAAASPIPAAEPAAAGGEAIPSAGQSAPVGALEPRRSWAPKWVVYLLALAAGIAAVAVLTWMACVPGAALESPTPALSDDEGADAAPAADVAAPP